MPDIRCPSRSFQLPWGLTDEVRQRNSFEIGGAGSRCDVRCRKRSRGGRSFAHALMAFAEPQSVLTSCQHPRSSRGTAHTDLSGGRAKEPPYASATVLPVPDRPTGQHEVAEIPSGDSKYLDLNLHAGMCGRLAGLRHGGRKFSECRGRGNIVLVDGRLARYWLKKAWKFHLRDLIQAKIFS